MHDINGLKISVWSDDREYALYFRVNASDCHIYTNIVWNGEWVGEKMIY